MIRSRTTSVWSRLSSTAMTFTGFYVIGHLVTVASALFIVAKVDFGCT